MKIQFVLLLSFYTMLGYTQTATFRLQFSNPTVNGNTVDVDFGIGSEGMAFALGSSNLVFVYEPAAVSNPVLLNHTLSATDYYSPTLTQQGADKGSVNVVLVPGKSGLNVPVGAFVPLGTVRFTIADPSATLELDWKYSGSTTETVVFEDDETSQVLVTDSGSDLIGISGAALPVAWKAFQVHWKDERKGISQLGWETAFEHSNAGFTIERKPAGSDWLPVGRVGAVGDTEGASYTWTDHIPDERINTCFYRIRQTDLDGSVSYSPVRVLHRARSADALMVYPSVFTNSLRVQAFSETAALQLFNADGQCVRAWPNARLPFQVDGLDKLPSGNYVLHARAGGKIQTVRLVKP